MSRFPSQHPGTEPLPWDGNDNAYYSYLDPSDRDEYDDFAYERSRRHPNLPQTNVSISAKGSIRTSYQSRYRPEPSSQHSSRSSRSQLTPPGQAYAPEYAGDYTSPTRSLRGYQDDSMYSRSYSPTRAPLTRTAAGAYGGYEMIDRRPGGQEPPSAWLQEEQKARKKRKYVIIGLLLFLLVCVVAGVTVYLIKFRKSSGSSSSGGTGNTGGRNGLGATASDLKPDPSLKRIFDGMDYTPLNAQYPGCGAIQENVTADVAILQQLTTKVRLYGTDCEQATMTLNAIQNLKVNMTVFVGVWVDNNSTTLQRQLNAMYEILQKYPTDLIEGIAVGNEVLFRQDLTETQLISLIQEVRKNVTAMNLSKNIPICTSDLGSNWSPQLSAAVDCVMANIHPFFSGINVTQAAQWTINFLNTNVVPTTQGLDPKPKIIISEVGWPSGSGSVNSSVAGIPEMQFFIDHFLPTVADASISYYWFEGYDEPWKIQFDTPTAQYEDHWVPKLIRCG